ncbi:MAG: hypothetical protein HQL69_14555 [Magnetococcales bacterium]|nr:hypothetical protein [Magnetococcales bacterium]
MSQEQNSNLTVEEKLSLASQHYKAGNLDEAALLNYELTKLFPDNENLLLFAGKTTYEQKDFNSTIDYLSRALIINPNNETALFMLGSTLLAKGNSKGAQINLQKAVKINPEFNIAWYTLATVYIFNNDNKQALPILLDIVRRDKTHYDSYLQLYRIFKNNNRFIMSRIFWDLYLHYYSGPPLEQNDEENVVYDTLFLNRDIAYSEAIKQNSFQQTIAKSLVQVCYYLGEEFTDGPDNLILVPLDKIGEFFCYSLLRRPAKIQFDPTNKDEINTALNIANALQSESSLQVKEMKKNTELCKIQQPDFSSQNPLKIFLVASRFTTVLQYSSRDLAEAFLRKGCDVKLVIEENDFERIEMRHYLQECAIFIPNAIININHLYNENIHKDIYIISWWQDLMPEIAEGKPINWRQRDLAISAYTTFDEPLYKSGAKQVYRQDHCIDPIIFSPKTPFQQRNKIVFVGSSYINQKDCFGKDGHKVIALLQEKMVLGHDITDQYLHELSEKFAIQYDGIFYNLLPYVVRDTSIEWLCSLAKSLEYEVEVYGRWWDKNPIVAPYFKGELPHGLKVAKVYNEAKYAVAAMHRTVNSQRVAEIAACGCIPVLLDERGYPNVEKPHWDDECLFYKTKKDLESCFSRTPKNDPKVIAKNYTYDSFADKIITYIKTGSYPDKPIVKHNS